MARRWIFLLAALALAGCQGGRETDDLALAGSAPEPPAPSQVAPDGVLAHARCTPRRTAGGGTLAGRTLPVERIADIRLAKGEVVLTFDDGPMPGRTPRILDVLDEHGVRATFMMVGTMARSYPALVRKVAARGHTIGSHTDQHPNLARMSREAALREIARGERAVSAALSGSGRGMAPFFRFPYLADTSALRSALATRGTVVLDVDVDSKDYYRVPPEKVLERTMRLLNRRGRGIVLLHDIHERTVRALPAFLAALKREGYTVVHLVPAGEASCPSPAS
jgi:peptidoglycan/xylan/chitin deacetylase (PgdA/CDA1 family)